MKNRIVKDGNAFYEIDETCMKKKRQKQKEWERYGRRANKNKYENPGQRS